MVAINQIPYIHDGHVCHELVSMCYWPFICTHFALADRCSNVVTHEPVLASDREMEAVTTQWQRIEAHLLTLPHFPQPFFHPGATEEEIATAEAATGGFPFPEDFRSSLQRHNGQATFHLLLGMGALLSTQEIVEQWSVWQELLDAGSFEDFDAEVCSDGGHVKPKWWNPRWIPITHDGGGDHDCLDMDPGEAGTVGQVVQMWHDDGNRPLQAKSYLAWLTECADKLEDGRLVWEDGEGFRCVDSKDEEGGHEGAQDELQLR